MGKSFRGRSTDLFIARRISGGQSFSLLDGKTGFVRAKNHPPGAVFQHLFPVFCLFFAERTQLVFFSTYSFQSIFAFFSWVRLAETLFYIKPTPTIPRIVGGDATPKVARRASRAGASECKAPVPTAFGAISPPSHETFFSCLDFGTSGQNLLVHFGRFGRFGSFSFPKLWGAECSSGCAEPSQMPSNTYSSSTLSFAVTLKSSSVVVSPLTAPPPAIRAFIVVAAAP